MIKKGVSAFADYYWELYMQKQKLILMLFIVSNSPFMLFFPITDNYKSACTSLEVSKNRPL